MTKTLILNSSNITSSKNNQLTFSFPGGATQFRENKIALCGISIYYSWDNINSTNNTFTYTWIDSTINTVTIPSGFYTIQDINSFFQSTLITNTHYLVDSAGDYVYYLEFVENAQLYGIQFNSYPVPTSLPSGYTKPGSWSFPGTASTPRITISSVNTFSNIIGFNAGTYPSVTQTTNYSKISDSTPQITPIQSLILTCSLIDNPLSIPNNIMYCFSPNVTFGSLIQINPNSPIFNNIKDGFYQNLVITIYDQNFQEITIKDSNIVILLQIL